METLKWRPHSGPYWWTARSGEVLIALLYTPLGWWCEVATDTDAVVWGPYESAGRAKAAAESFS